MANSYANDAFTIDTSTNVAGLTALKGSASDSADTITVTGAAVLTVDAPLVCESITGAYTVLTGSVAITPAAADMYGSIAGVQAYVLAMAFTSTSKPSTADVTNMLIEQSASMNVRLAGSGYTVPVTDAAAVRLLESIAVRFVAAGVIERLVLGKSPDAAKVESAATWRREAEAIMTGIVAGTIPLTGAVKSGTATAKCGAGIHTGSESAFPHENRDAFILAHGAQTANPYGDIGATTYTDDSDA